MALINKKGTKPKIALDDGHGMTTAGKRTPTFPAGSGLKSETGNFMHENEFNRAVVRYLYTELATCGFDVVLTAPTDVDTPIGTRVKTANNAKCDLLISVHANAATATWGQANGVETLSAPKHKNVALVFQKHLMKGTVQKNRGWKDGSWLGLNGFSGPMVLIEAGFMDNLTEAKLLLSDNFRRECAKELAEATCEVFGTTYKQSASKPTTTTSSSTEYQYDVNKGIGTLTVLVDELTKRKDASFISEAIGTVTKGQVYYVYEEKNALYNIGSAWVSAGKSYTAFTPHPVSKLYKVQIGAFSIDTYANALVNDLKSKGFTAAIKKVGTLYKVQVGAFSVKENADVLAKQLKDKGFTTSIVHE